jgi:hypothetical protein
MTSGCLLAFVRGLTQHFARFEPAGEVSPKFEYRSFAQSRNRAITLACPDFPGVKGFFAGRGKWTMSNVESTIFRAAEAPTSIGTSPPGPLSSEERGKRGVRCMKTMKN